MDNEEMGKIMNEVHCLPVMAAEPNIEDCRQKTQAPKSHCAIFVLFRDHPVNVNPPSLAVRLARRAGASKAFGAKAGQTQSNRVKQCLSGSMTIVVFWLLTRIHFRSIVGGLKISVKSEQLLYRLTYLATVAAF